MCNDGLRVEKCTVGMVVVSRIQMIYDIYHCSMVC